MNIESQQHQEWTSQTVNDLARYDGYKGVADAHNAAREKQRQADRNELSKLENQLSGERQRREQQGKAYERLKADYKEKLNKALDLALSAQVAIKKAKEIMHLMHKATLQVSGTKAEADLGRESYLAFRKFIDTHFDPSAIRQHDADKQAEIDEAREQRDWLIKECGRVGVTVNVKIGAPITEAYRLVNNDAEVRKPLVDALNRVKEWHSENGEPRRIIDNALAKEGKIHIEPDSRWERVRVLLQRLKEHYPSIKGLEEIEDLLK